MSKFMEINVPRIEKMVKVIETIEKSARSNKATDEELIELFAPLVDLLGVNPQPATIEPEQKPVGSPKDAQWFSIRKAAEEAPLTDLTYAMAVIMSRVDEYIHDSKKGHM